MDIGAQLRASREAHGLSLETLAQRTRVQPRILAAIERNDIQGLPPKPYGRGFVRAYAAEIGRDPDETVRHYFAQFAPAVTDATGIPPPAPAPARPSPAWIWLAGTSVAVAGLVLWSVGSSSTQERGQETVVGTSGGSPAAVAASSGAETEARARERDGSTVVAETVTVLLTATRDCWVTATADGERVIFRLLRAGDRETLRGQREVVIRAGDAGALVLTINGRAAGPFGSRGQVRTLQITPANATSIGQEQEPRR